MKKNLEDLPELNEWLDDYAFNSNDIETQLMVVDAEEVKNKLIVLGSEIERLRFLIFHSRHILFKKKLITFDEVLSWHV